LLTGGYFDSILTIYNTVLKLLFLASTFYCVYLLRVKYRHTYDRSHDTVRVSILLGASALLALIFPQRYSVLEILWSFSQFLEAVAIFPQLWLLRRTGEVENLTSHYIFCLGGRTSLLVWCRLLMSFSLPGVLRPKLDMAFRDG
jgi:ER lumen protein retaining receptor